MRVLFFIILASLPFLTQAQPETEVYIFKLKQVNTTYELSEPWNVSGENPGYDNQPHFLPDGKSMYYVSTRNGQTDVIQVEFKESSWAWLTFTEGGEYSPTPIINGAEEAFSAIRLDRDGTQLLYQYPLDLSKPKVLVPELKIGYHCWISENLLAAFVLGEPSTLQLCHIAEGTHKIYDQNIGRSLHKIPNEGKVSYISKKSDPWKIMQLDPVTGVRTKITDTLDGVEDMAWTPAGDIIMGQGSKIYKFSPSVDTSWVLIADLDDFSLGNVTRIAVSPLGDRIAIVVDE
ncbi:MAG: hypothetical protein AAF843_06555 [Bacteroidota bacterium]